MPWYFPWSESIKKRACRYLLQHYLGDFLKEKLDLDQLTVDLYNGKGTVTEVLLDVWALNEMLSSSGVPMELVDGFIESISVSVPWKALLNDSCEIEIHGLQLVFATRQKSEASLAESINSWNSMSMTTSIQMAQECLRQDPTLSGESQDARQSFDGLEAFAQTIESVLARVRLSFVNTKIRLEHIPLASTTGVAVDLTIDRIDYWDLSHEEVGKENTPQHSVYEPVAVAIKNFQMIGINLYIEEFAKHKRTRLRDIYSDEDLSSIPMTPVKEELSKLQRRKVSWDDEDESRDLIPKIKLLSSCGKQNVRIRLKQNESIPGPKFDMEYSLAALNIFMTPRQLHLLSDVVSSLSDAASTHDNSSSDPKENLSHHRKMKMREMKTEDFMKVEESLQNQFHSIESQDWKTNLNSLNSLNDSPYGSLAKQRSSSDDEFFSMGEFPLPQLGQPTLLNTVKQCNLTGQTTMNDDFTAGRFSPTSPRSTLSNVSLGGSSGSLNSKGTLTERASTVFRASSSSSPSNRQVPQPFMASPSGTTGIGLAGISKIDDATDSTKIRLRASNVIMILLHRDPFMATNVSGGAKQYTTTSGGSGGGGDREDCVEEMSTKFFDQVNQYSIQSLFGVNGEDIRENLLHLCSYDHLRVLASALNLEAESTLSSNGISLNTDIILGKLSIDENLYDELKSSTPYSQVQLLHFDHQDVSPLYPGNFGASQSPSIKVNITRSNRNSFSGVHSRSTLPPKSQVTVDFGLMIIDLDLTIIDRIASLLWPGALYKTSTHYAPASFNNMYNSLATGRSANHHSDFKQVILDNSGIVEYKTDIVCRCPEATVLLRVPIPDLRPSGDIEKKPWWRKSVYTEHLKVKVTTLELKTFVSSLHSTLSTYDIGFKKAKGFFVTTDNQHYHVFDISSTTEEGETGSMGVDQPRILLNLLPPSARSVLEETENTSKNSSPDSIEDQYPWMKSEPSPFSTQPNMYNENEEMVTPGSIAEMNAFQEFVSTSAKTGVNCYFPSMQVNLHSNDIFELFYNRIFGALVMWEPSAPSPIDVAPKSTNPYESVHINLASHIGQLDSGNIAGGGVGVGGDKFFMCRSAIRGDAFESHSIDENSFFSGDFNDHQTALPKHQQQTNFCFSLHIDQGKVAMFPPAKFLTNTENTFEPILGDLPTGHVVLNIKDGHLFVASGFKGNPNVDFIELYSNSVELYHSSLLNEALQMNLMEDALCVDYLERTIYPSEPSVQCKCKSATGCSSMLSLAVKSTSFPEQKRKDNTVSVGLRGGTLDHRVLPPGHSWLTQIMDFMDVQDYPILGFTFPTVMTTLHLHLWGCAVDYRPKSIPIHSFVTMESLSLSSNIIPGSSTSILRFIIEDSALHICDKTFIDTGDFNDFVTVVDMGTFELSLKFTNGSDPRQPIFDLSMSNNMLNIRTCADSCTALMKLVKYFASDGDLQSGIVGEMENETTESDVPFPSQTISEGQSDESIDIHSLMADAMDDTEEDCIGERFQGTVIDECFDTSGDYDDDQDVDEEDGEQSSADEFCLLDNDQAGGEDMKEFEPIIRKIIDRDIVIIEDFITIPQGKHDQLLSPEGYPTATHRYTVKEMSVVWQMYGGSDFGHPSSSSSYSSSDGRRQSHGSFGTRYESNTSKTNRVNRVKGGPNRDLDTLMELQMNKIRFQHENFPDSAKQIYRDVLLVYDIEIRDRLSSSKINKFLYRFSSENMPKQSSANMIAIRFLVTKPEDSARSEEAALRISLQPLRLNVDQDSLFFLRDFFSQISGTKPPEKQRPLSQADFSTPLSSSPGVEPFQTISESSPAPSPQQRIDAPIRHSLSSESLKSEKQPPSLFIKSFLFSPEVPIRLDYQGKHVNIEQGTIAGLIMGLSQLNCSELRLKRLCSRSGLLGVDKLANFIVSEWLNDIKQNQLQSILGGVGPTYSLMQLFQGLKDLFWMPFQQYRQDGRIVRGLQRGAHSFSTSTAMAVLELSNRLVTTMQSLAELTFDMVSSEPSHVSTRGGHSNQSVVHPAELREGIANAYAVLTEGLSQTAQNIVRVATEEHEKKGMTGAVGGVLRQIPPTVVKPLILATEATSNVLGGAINQLAPDKRKEALEKWKSDTG